MTCQAPEDGFIVVEPGAIKTEIWTKGRETAERLESSLPAEASALYREQFDSIVKGNR